MQPWVGPATFAAHPCETDSDANVRGCPVDKSAGRRGNREFFKGDTLIGLGFQILEQVAVEYQQKIQFKI